jgi:predicted transcriptional regulator
VEDLSSGMEGSTKNTDKQIQWRRTKVLELCSQGNTQSDIAKTLRVGEATVSRDISSLRQQAQLNLKTHINDKLPEEYQNCMTGLNQALKICWEIVNKSRNTNNDDGNQTVTMTDNKTVLQALALINDCNKYKMDLTTNGVVITDAIKFVQTNKEKLTMSTKIEDNGSKENNEPDYDDGEDKERLEEKQEEETGEISEKETTNQVF